jgi:excisionase family DNA binding protein
MSHNNLPQLIYTVREAVQITRLSRTTLWKAVKSGKLKTCRIGARRVLFTLTALQDFLNNNS